MSLITAKEADYVKQEIKAIEQSKNPLDYKGNSSHYHQLNLPRAIAEYVVAVGRVSWFLGAALKYILRRRFKGQYAKDVVKIVHCLHLSLPQIRSSNPTERQNAERLLTELTDAVYYNIKDHYRTYHMIRFLKAMMDVNKLGQREFIAQITEILQSEMKEEANDAPASTN